MSRLKNYTKAFIKDESGMELLQLAIVVVITVALIGVVMTLRDSVENNIEDATDMANDQMGGLLGS